MCWVSNKLHQMYALQDKIVYKVVLKKDITYHRKYIFFGKKKMISVKSLIINYKYTPYLSNPRLELRAYRDVLVYGKYSSVISRGYHSYTLKEAKHQADLDKFAIIQCIIPQGSIYYKNKYGEFVSDQLILTDQIIEQ